MVKHNSVYVESYFQVGLILSSSEIYFDLDLKPRLYSLVFNFRINNGKIVCKNETRTELSGLIEKLNVRRMNDTTLVYGSVPCGKHGSGSIMVSVCFVASEAGCVAIIDGIMHSELHLSVRPKQCQYNLTSSILFL